jgi:hypothetical protein
LQSDGSCLPGEHYWTAVTFVAHGMHPNNVVGKYSRLQLQNKQNFKEVWEFFDAVVMLAPDDKGYTNYVVTYEGVQRVTGNIES